MLSRSTRVILISIVLVLMAVSSALAQIPTPVNMRIDEKYVVNVGRKEILDSLFFQPLDSDWKPGRNDSVFILSYPFETREVTSKVRMIEVDINKTKIVFDSVQIVSQPGNFFFSNAKKRKLTLKRTDYVANFKETVIDAIEAKRTTKVYYSNPRE